MGIQKRILKRGFAFCAAMQVVGALASPPVSVDSQVWALQQTIFQADRQGDFGTAVKIAEECMAIKSALPPGLIGYYCESYLAAALKQGRGIARDEVRSFLMVNDLAAQAPDDDAALDLAEDYLDGSGTIRDRVEAAVLAWRVDYGFWSFYGPYWGMCTAGCDALWAREKALDRRLDRELTENEKALATSVETARYPEIEKRVKDLDREMLTIGVAMFAAICGGIALRRRKSKRDKLRLA